MIKRIILAAALCAALGTCGFTEVSAAEETNGNEEITVIKGKILRTETVKRADKHSKAQKTEKKEKAAVKKEQKALLSKEKQRPQNPKKR